jgi:hypothetical protein
MFQCVCVCVCVCVYKLHCNTIDQYVQKHIYNIKHMAREYSKFGGGSAGGNKRYVHSSLILITQNFLTVKQTVYSTEKEVLGFCKLIMRTEDCVIKC